MSAATPFSFEPMLCESAERPPEGCEWRYELKLDGFRAIGRKSGRSAQLWSRNQKDFTRRFPDLAKGIAELPSDTVIDGEIVGPRRQRQALVQPAPGLRQRPGDRAVRLRFARVAGKDVRLWPLEE